MRIYFVYRGRSMPSGGHKQTRLMALNLNELGAKSYLLLDSATHDQHLYSVSAPVAPFSFEDACTHLSYEDVVIFPEVCLDHYFEATRTWRCRKAVLIQNGFYALDQRPRCGYRRNGVEFVFAITPTIASLASEFFGMEPERVCEVPIWALRAPFGPASDSVSAPSRRLTVCYMPRKLPGDIVEIRAVVQRTEPDVPWVEIDGLPEQEVADRFRSVAIFLSTQNREGCPLPALEAMSCGCLVAGYAGTHPFPHPYATEENGLWAPDGSIREAIAQVLRGIRLVRRGGEELDDSSGPVA